MLQFNQITLRRGPRVLFDNLNGALFDGERVALVGANGAGKSSLLALIRGELQADTGDLAIQGGKHMAFVSQEIPPTDQSTLDFVLDGDEPLRRCEQALIAATAANDIEKMGRYQLEFEGLQGYAARARAARLLAGLGFSADEIERPMRSFSGGWQRRMALARALMARSDILMLDEPTNHLDLDAIIWLEQWLLQYSGLLILIAHDRDFLDRLATNVMAIENGRVTFYKGDYSDYETKRAAHLAEQNVQFARIQAQAEKIKSFVERFKAKASKARQAQSRLKALARLPSIAPAQADSPFEFSFKPPRKLPQPLLTLNEVSAGYDTRVIVSGVNLSLNPGSRIGLLGRNGAGKSTLMRVIAGAAAPLAGERIAAADLVQGYFEQHQLNTLVDTESAFWHLTYRSESAVAKGTELERRQFLAGFGFTGDRVFEPVGPFSGGERARLVLALIVARAPNVLLLDEPTNHLDLQMREALNLALLDYPGAIILVSHDRHLLRSICDELWWVRNGRAELFNGNLDDYAQALAKDSAETPPATDSVVATPEFKDPKERRRQAALARERLAPLKRLLGTLEKKITRYTEQLAALNVELADEALYQPEQKQQLVSLTTRRSAIQKELDEAESEWLRVADELQIIEK